MRRVRWTREDPRYPDREAAGRAMARLLQGLKDGNPMVLGIARGGVAVGAGLAGALGAPLEVITVRKIPIPWSPEEGLGAVTSDGDALFNQDTLAGLSLTREELERLADPIRTEVARREARYRSSRPEPQLGGRTIILTDDGLATGFTTLAASRSAAAKRPAWLIIASPVATQDAVDLLRDECDRLITEYIHPRGFSFAVANYYDNFHDLTDEEVLAYLDASDAEQRSGEPEERSSEEKRG